jgi:hypothetical protein
VSVADVHHNESQADDTTEECHIHNPQGA